MSEVVYKDYLPANARIVVNYRAKEKVKFSYPIEWTYWKAVRKRAYPTVIGFVGLLILQASIYFCLIAIPYQLVSLYFNPVSYFVKSHQVTWDLVSTARYVGTLIGFEILILGVIPGIITLYLALDKERLSRWIPKLGYWSARMIGKMKEKIFYPIDIVENKAVIPIFSNVFLQYECSDDFNRYLDKIEIVEIPFSYKMTRFFLPFLRKSKKEKNDFEFRAVFYFSQKPKNGKLEVLFS